MSTALIRARYESAVAKAVQHRSLNAVAGVLPYDPFTPVGPLNRYAYFFKDNFAHPGSVVAGASNFLFDFRPGYGSTVLGRLRAAGAVCIGRANMDEFGLGGTGTNSAYGTTLNPIDQTRVAGGSSSGSAALVAAHVCDFSLGTDTGDSIRRPASYVGVYGYKPSYGLLSRYGVFPYAPSLDTVGVFARNLETVAHVLDATVGTDPRDATTYDAKPTFAANLKPVKGRLVVLDEVVAALKPEVASRFAQVVDRLKERGYQIVNGKFSLKLLEALLPTYCALSFAEAASCYANLSGVLFGAQAEGSFEQAAKQARSAELGTQFKRRLIIGAYCMSKDNFEPIFQQTKRVRRLIVNELHRVLALGDGLLLPAANDVAPKLTDVKSDVNFVTDDPDVAGDSLLIANFGGNPSMTIPAGYVDSLPWGVNVMTGHAQDQECINLSLGVAEAINGL